MHCRELLHEAVSRFEASTTLHLAQAGQHSALDQQESKNVIKTPTSASTVLFDAPSNDTPCLKEAQAHRLSYAIQKHVSPVGLQFTDYRINTM
jgi:hypothetical protein